MGRHARGAAHLRVSVSTIVLGTLIVTVVAVGSLFSSNAQPTPIAAEGVEGTAVVVSSLACHDGAGGTQVDVLSPAGLPAGTAVRASLDACGYQEGEQIAVHFAASDPTRVTLRGNPAEETVTAGRLLPYGLILAALLAAGAATAVALDGRRNGRARATSRAERKEPGSSDRGALDTGTPNTGMPNTGTPNTGTPNTGTPNPGTPNTWSTAAFGALEQTMLLPASEPRGRGDSPRPTGRHARPDPDRGGRHSPEHSPSPLLVTVPAPGAAIEPGEPVQLAVSGHRELSSLDLSFPFTASLADSLHDELFTHRTVWS